MKQYDAIIIGFGKAGKVLAAELAKKKWSVALIERSPEMYGGSCINIACVPTKRLVQESKISNLLSQTDVIDRMGIYRNAIDKKNELTNLLRGKAVDDLAQYPEITIYTGEASFVSADTVEVKMSEGNEQLQGKEIFINTGSECIKPAIDGLETSKKVYSTGELLNLDILPKHLIIIGCGAAGMEFASIYNNFGSKVTVIEALADFMPYADRDFAGSILSTLEKRGIDLLFNNQVLSITDIEDEVKVEYIDRTNNQECMVEGDAVLIATGRRPNTKDLNLDAAGVKIDDTGAIVVNNHLHTDVPHVWAMGDVRGGTMSTALAIDDCRIILNKLFGDDTRSTDDRIPEPHAFFTDPPIAYIGITENEAIKKGYNFKVSRLLVNAVTRSHTLKQTEGMMKAIVNADTQKVIGCALFCCDAPEIINIINMAMKLEQPYTFLRDFIFTHPSMSEAFNQLFDIE